MSKLGKKLIAGAKEVVEDTQLRRQIDIHPGFCWLHEDPTKNYGVAGCKVCFYVIGPKGAVQWVILTDWYPAAARQHLRQFSQTYPSLYDRQPMAADLGIHSREPMYEGQQPKDECSLLKGTCYYDGSSLNAEKWVEGFLNGGSEWLWEKLEQYYRYAFEKGEYPDVTPVIRPSPALRN